MQLTVGGLEIVKFLLAKGANPALVDNFDYSAISLAEYHKHVDIADYIRSYQD
jgi:ankyrin repeat protein